MEEDISSIPRFSGSVNLGARMKLSAYILTLQTKRQSRRESLFGIVFYQIYPHGILLRVF